MSIKKRRCEQSRIAIVYDFDGTLAPGNMQEETIFREYGIRSEEFWNRAEHLVRRKGYERTLAYLKLLLHEPAFRSRPLSRDLLKKLAGRVRYFPGVRSYFRNFQKNLQAIPEVREWGIEVEHYIVSSGMAEILEGMDIYPYFRKVYACEYEYERGKAVFPKLVINDTNKTQFLFRINKGRLRLSEDINSHMDERLRPVPFRNMIYIGDSATDIPSMTVTRHFGGSAIAVFDRRDEVSRHIKRLVRDEKVSHFAPADYRKGSLLDKILTRTLKKVIFNIAYHGSSGMSRNWVLKHR